MPYSWRFHRGRRPCTPRQTGFQPVLLAALNTHYYGFLLEAAGLGTPEAIEGLGSLEEALDRLPRVEPGLVPLGSDSLLNWNEPEPEPAELFWPLPPAGRTAVLSGGFREDDSVRLFSHAAQSEFARWRPEALAGEVEALCRLARRAEGLQADSWTLSHSVLVLMHVRRGFLTPEARELMWRTWKVPAFGQLFGPSGELLAWECEAHAGYHFDPDQVVFESHPRGGDSELLATSLTGLRRPAIRLATCLAGRIEHSACGCGLAGPRLVGLSARKPATATSACAARAACAAD